MPLYAKFLKELITRTRNCGDKETVVLTEECSAIIQKKLPQKMKDPVSFQIPCIIGDISIEKALCDLGASINLMSLAMMKRMRIKEAKLTRMALQLADRTFKFPHGVVEDLLVKVEEFIFPADFVVLDMEKEANTSIILGRPFLATARVIIDVQKGELVLRLHEEEMVFNVFKAMSYPKESIGEYMMVDTIETLVQGVLEKDKLKEVVEQDQQALGGEQPQEFIKGSIMLDKASKKEVEAPKVELKTLLPSLKLIRWILLLQEFNIEIKDRSGAENKVADHLSRIPNEENEAHSLEVNESFSDEQLMMIQEAPWFADIANFKAIGELPSNINKHLKRKLINDAKYYIWDEPYLFKSGERTAHKMLQYGFFWPKIFKDAKELVARCNECQRAGNLPKKNEMPQRFIMELELFDVWGIDSMGPFPSSYSNKYILVAVDYVSKWVEAIATSIIDNKVVINFLRKNIFSRFGVLRALISDGGTHFRNKQLETLLLKYGVKHKMLNFDNQAAGERRLLQLNELEEFKTQAYENAKIYKEKTTKWYDQKLARREFVEGQKVLLYNLRLKFFPRKLKSRWSGPFTIVKASPYGHVELMNEKTQRTFTVNGHRLKHCSGDSLEEQRVNYNLS
ncbi:uncharacterized protein [Arachis hypogaea]|uniref:uncharacterized protein n=1 Tax=Arachis hypogaea TaxID=3818 RepID=UPI003B21E1F8